MTVSEIQEKLDCHIFVRSGVFIFIPKSGSLKNLMDRANDYRPKDIMFLFYENINEYEETWK